MKHARLILNILLIVALLSAPVAFAQPPEEETDCGFLGIECGFIADILSLLRDIIEGFFNFLRAAVEFGIALVVNIVNFLVTAFRNVIQILINLFQPLIDLIAGILRIIGELVQIVVLILQIVVGFFILLVTFAFQAVAIIVQIIGQFFAAPSTAIPGLPQCVTDPTAWQLCAAYYILDWTLWAPSTPGAIIVPLIVILVDVKIVFFFIRKIMSILNIGEKVTDV